MPIPTLQRIRRLLAHPPEGVRHSALLDVSVPSHPALALSFELNAHPDVLAAVRAEVAAYHRRCEDKNRMKQIDMIDAGAERARLTLFSLHAAQPGIPGFVHNLFGGTDSTPELNPSTPADLTSMRKALLGKP